MVNDLKDPKHVRIRSRTTLPNGEVEIKTESYYEELRSDSKEIQKNVRTTKETFLKDIITCLSLITEKHTNELTLRITTDAMRQPKTITRTYTLTKNVYRQKQL